MSFNQPFVSILMPVYNGEKYLKKAIDSILNQTYTNYEFIIINDGSTDNSENIILSFKDKRIKYFIQKENKNIVETLNKGISIAKGTYIARMDQDDISLPNRIEKQIDYMESNSNIGACGSSITYMSNNPSLNNKILEVVSCPNLLKINLLLDPVIFHPTAVLRSEILKKYDLKYKKSYEYAEDYHLWVQISKVSSLGNVKETLLKYRVHAESMSINKRELQKSIHTQVIKEQLEYLSDRLVTTSEILFISKWASKSFLRDLAFSLLLFKKNIIKKIYNQKKFFIFLTKRLKYSFHRNFCTLH